MTVILDYTRDFLARINNTEWILLAVLAGFFLVQMVYWAGLYTPLLGFNRKIRKGRTTYSKQLPPVSVVICARNEKFNMERFLPLVLEQDYPDYEVVVVDDGSIDDTKDYLTLMKSRYEHLTTTFVPEEAKFINSKKFALTLGIKASKHDLLVLTDADCYPKSNHWLRQMVRNFEPDIQLVLGFGPYRKEKGLLNYLIGFDTLTIGIQYLNYALLGMPYMGVGRNLAYRKSLFEKNHGFVHHLNIQSGDDDLFVNEVADKTNTRIEISPESMTESIPETRFKFWIRQKRRHLSAAGHYKFSSKCLLGLESFSRAAFYGMLTACMVAGGTEVRILTALLFGIRYLTQWLVVNLSAKQLGQRRYWVGILAFDLLLPLISLVLLMQTGSNKDKMSTW